MFIVFVPIISGLSLAYEPAFKKAPRGSPLDGALDLSGSSAFI